MSDIDFKAIPWDSLARDMPEIAERLGNELADAIRIMLEVDLQSWPAAEAQYTVRSGGRFQISLSVEPVPEDKDEEIIVERGPTPPLGGPRPE